MTKSDIYGVLVINGIFACRLFLIEDIVPPNSSSANAMCLTIHAAELEFGGTFSHRQPDGAYLYFLSIRVVRK